MEQLNLIFEEMKRIVHAAGKSLLDREASRQIQEKGYADFVTEVDLHVQKMVCTQLQELFPDIQFMGEEKDNSDIDFSKAVWILDPVDGTSNLIHDLHMSAISLGLIVGGEAVAGVIYQPYLDELFAAVKGGGATLNGSPISVSAPDQLRDCIIALGTAPYHHDLADRTFDAAKKVFLSSMDIRRSGSAALDLACVAAGRVDGMFELILQPWDFAAGKIIVEEAGGAMTTVDGKPVNLFEASSVLATNRKIHAQMEKILAE